MLPCEGRSRAFESRRGRHTHPADRFPAITSFGFLNDSGLWVVYCLVLTSNVAKDARSSSVK